YFFVPNLCESFLNVEEVCDLHGEKLKLFCVEDKESVCLVCRDSEKHKWHKFRTISELLPSYKVRKESNAEQYLHTERRINEEFKKLHQFLIDEKEALITALWEEEEQKIQMMKQKLEEMNTQISALSDTIKHIEEQMKAKDATSPTLDYFVSSAPVILDPNTAHPELTLSDDLTGLTWSTDTHACPANPERFDVYPCVLGSEGFTSGTHCWDVEVGNNTHWTVGITTASNPRKGFTFFGKDVWCVWYKNNKYFSYYQDQAYTPISVKEKLQRVRVLLDWDGGKVSFSDPVTDTHLCSLTINFTERLFPFFSSVCVTCNYWSTLCKKILFQFTLKFHV
uniref:B30.2/SPRY domain-containing protein n=1 Tax=Sinocyclocheilus anshuiensis TaxID=1608454 RepID=A0A671QM51_9TELE